MNRHPQCTRPRSPLLHLVQWLVVLVALAVCGFDARTSSAQEVDEYKVKLAYLYKIAMYVNRGETTGLTASEKLRIGILGKDPFGSLLDRLAASRKIHNRVIEVRRFLTADDLEDCDLLFVGKDIPLTDAQRRRIRTVCKSALIVGDSPGIENLGGVFAMYLDDQGRVGLRLNVDAATRDRYQVDARLMQICDIVRDEVASQQANKNR